MKLSSPMPTINNYRIVLFFFIASITVQYCTWNSKNVKIKLQYVLPFADDVVNQRQ